MQEVLVSYLDGTPTRLTYFMVFPPSCYANVAARPQPFPSSYFPVHFQSFTTIEYELQVAMLNTPLINFIHRNLKYQMSYVHAS
jgi:hypothetical protein